MYRTEKELQNNILARSDGDFFAIFYEQLCMLAVEKRLAYAVEHKELIIRYNLRDALFQLSEQDRETFLAEFNAELTAEKFSGIIDLLRPGDFRKQFILSHQHLITCINLAAMTTYVYSRSDDRLEFLTNHPEKIASFNLAKVLNILSEGCHAKFIAEYEDKITPKNVAEILQFIPVKKYLSFFKKRHYLVDQENFSTLFAMFTLNKRNDFLKTHIDKVTHANLAIIASLLSSKNTAKLIEASKHLLTSQNLVDVIMQLDPEMRFAWMIEYKHLVNLSNFRDLIGILPDVNQLEFLTTHVGLLCDQPQAVWIHHAAVLELKSRYQFILSFQDRFFRNDDIFTLVWAMEILDADQGLMLAISNVSMIHQPADLRAIIDGKALSVEAKLKFMRFYILQIQAAENSNQYAAVMQTCVIENLSKVTGKIYKAKPNSGNPLLTLTKMLSYAEQKISEYKTSVKNIATTHMFTDGQKLMYSYLGFFAQDERKISTTDEHKTTLTYSGPTATT